MDTVHSEKKSKISNKIFDNLEWRPEKDSDAIWDMTEGCIIEEAQIFLGNDGITFLIRDPKNGKERYIAVSPDEEDRYSIYIEVAEVPPEREG